MTIEQKYKKLLKAIHGRCEFCEYSCYGDDFVCLVAFDLKDDNLQCIYDKNLPKQCPKCKCEWCTSERKDLWELKKELQ